MAWLAREFISVPDEHKDQIVYKWPDRSIRRFSRAIVDADEVALFVRSGTVLATLGPGRHRVDAEELPGLGALVDTFTGGNYYRAELYFVGTREYAGLPFGGRLTDLTDPISNQVVTLRTYGEFALSVRDPAQLITALVGTAALTDPRRLQRWSAALLLKSMKIAVAQGVSRGDWPVLGIAAELPAIEAVVVRETNIALYDYGLRISRMGDADISLDPEDAQRLKRLAKDHTYIDLAGDFGRYAAGELALGAGTGLAQTAGDTHAGLAAGLEFSAIQRYIDPPARPSPWSARQHAAECRTCASAVPPGARYCPACGEPTAR